MNEQDLRDCFAMFAMCGWIMNGDYSKEEIPSLAFDMADAMLEARTAKDSIGLPPVRARKTKEK